MSFCSKLIVEFTDNDIIPRPVCDNHHYKDNYLTLFWGRFQERNMKKVKENNFYKWSVEKGDYKRDQESTISYLKKRILIKKIKQSFWIFLYLTFVSAFSYIIFTVF